MADVPITVEQALDEMRTASRTCDACKLAHMRTQVVFGHGNPRSPLVLIGQSPGEQEDQSGLPFVGRAGQLLNECLAEIGIRREQIWITNIVKCRPWEKTEAGRGKNRDPEPDEVEACTPWIETELALIQPRVIVCIGAPSAKLILGHNLSISRERGHWFTEHRFKPAYITAVLHPAYILRQHGRPFDEMRAHFVEDLEAARVKTVRALKEPTPPAEPPKPAPHKSEQQSLFGDG